MANTPQAKKRIRRNATAPTINHARVSRIRTFIKAVETAIASGKKADAADALKQAQPEIARGVARGVIHKNTAVAEVFAAVQAGCVARLKSGPETGLKRAVGKPAARLDLGPLKKRQQFPQFAHGGPSRWIGKMADFRQFSQISAGFRCQG